MSTKSRDLFCKINVRKSKEKQRSITIRLAFNSKNIDDLKTTGY